MPNKQDKIDKLVETFKKKSVQYFINTISLIDIDYNKFFNCLTVSDLKLIYETIKSESASSANKSSKKIDYINILTTNNDLSTKA